MKQRLAVNCLAQFQRITAASFSALTDIPGYGTKNGLMQTAKSSLKQHDTMYGRTRCSKLSTVRIIDRFMAKSFLTLLMRSKFTPSKLVKNFTVLLSHC